jgi:predicted fused transcriptional regulator/phosphomethylpyrimidine kinase
MLESSPIAHHLVPEVSTNVAESVREPKELNDVAAVPGRIVRVGSALRAVGRPSFGTSKHLASLLLKAKRNGIGWSAVVNIRFDEDVLRALRETGMKYAVTTYPAGSPRSEEEVVEAVVEALRRDPGIEVVLDAGGPGLEPAAYVFGKDSVDAVARVLKIARAYVAVRGN